jgi:hypothetical protein
MEARSESFKFRLSKEELAAIAMMAQASHLPAGTFVRRELMLMAEQRGTQAVAVTE